MDQETVEYTDGNYINMQIEELPYYKKDENDGYLKFPGDDDDLENNTFLPLLIPTPKRKIISKKNKKTKNKKQKGKPKKKMGGSRKPKSGATLSANSRR